MIFEYESLGDKCIEHLFISEVDDGNIILNEENIDLLINNVLVGGVKQLDEKFIPDTIARKSDIPVPIIINYNTIKDAANSEVNTISEQTWLKYIAKKAMML